MTNKNQYYSEFKKILKLQILKYKLSLDARGKKPIYSYNKYIKIFLEKLETGLSWQKLEDIYGISKSQLQITFAKWTNYDIFKKAYEYFLKKYRLYIDNEYAYVDTTTILNKYGFIDSVHYNPFESGKHKSNKLSCIVNNNGIPLGIKLSNGNIHDITLLLDTLPKKPFFKMLYADKGYTSKELKAKLISKGISFIYPHKKNSIVKNTPEERFELKNRMKIENFNNFLKQNRTINTRYIKDEYNFLGFIYLACLKIGLRNIFFNFFKD
jgi:transposase